MKKLFFICSILLCIPFVAQSEIRNVPDDYETIQAGIDAAEEGDTVLVQPGEYVENINFGGKSIIVSSVFLTTGLDESIDSTVINGNQNGSVVRFDHGESESSILMGFTIINGTGSEDLSGDLAGGGITCLRSSPTLKNLIIKNNTARYGGGIMIQMSSPILTNVVVRSNEATRSSGGIYCSRDSTFAKIYNSVIVNNHAGGLASGFGMYGRAKAILTNVNILNNTGFSTGFGSTWGNQAVLTNCIIRGNERKQLIIGAGEAYDDSIAVLYSDIEGGFDSVIVVQDDIFTNLLLWGDGNIDSDPLFLDPDNSDYHLTAESPCIDSGDPDAELDPDGTRADMGAFYFHQQDIEVEPLLLEFRMVEVGMEDSLSVVVRNTGNTVLTVHEFVWSENPHPYFIREEWFDEEISPDDSRELWVIFAPQPELESDASLFLVTSDPDEGEVIVDARGAMDAGSNFILHPSFFNLSAYPNPFNSSTTIHYRVGANSNSPVTISIYDLSGRLVETLINRAVPAGNNTVVWDASGVGAGVYFVRLDEDPPHPPLKKGGVDSRMIRKLVVIK